MSRPVNSHTPNGCKRGAVSDRRGYGTRWPWALLVLVLAGLLAAGCADGSTTTRTEGTTPGSDLADEQTLVLNIGAEPRTIDPARVEHIPAANVVQPLFSGLLKMTGDDNEVVPDLAADLPSVSKDGTEYTFRLRDDITWSNGEPITAEDVRYGFQRAMSKATAGGLAYQGNVVVGAVELREGKGKPGDLGVKVIDEKTVRFTLKRVTPWFDQLVALPVFYPAPSSALKQHGDEWTEPGNIVTSGPFTLEEWEHGQFMKFRKNEDYWDADNVRLDRIEAQIIRDPRTAFNQFKAEELDAGFPGTMVGESDLDEAQQMPEYKENPVLGEQYLWMNTKHPALANSMVREAITRAIDRRRLSEEVLRGGEKPSGTFAPEGIAGYGEIEDGHQDSIDPDGEVDEAKVKELLEEGGWKDGDALNVYYTTEGGNGQAIAEFLQSDLKQHGIVLKLVPQPEGAVLGDLATPPLQPNVHLVLIGWHADYDDPFTYYDLLTCRSALNVSQWCDEEYDDVVEEMGETVDDDARYELAGRAEGMLTGTDGSFPAAPIVRDTDRFLVKDHVENFTFSSLRLIDFAKVEIQRH